MHRQLTVFPPPSVSFSCFDKSVEEWRQFHCDLNDLSQWLAEAEGLLAEAQTQDGGLDLEMAKIHQQVSDHGLLRWFVKNLLTF